MRPILSAESPSIVTTVLPATAETGVVHERTAWPLTCTVHAPQTAMPQPNLVPVRPNSSRTTHINGVSGSSADETAFPFRVNFVAIPASPSVSPTKTRRRRSAAALASLGTRRCPRDGSHLLIVDGQRASSLVLGTSPVGTTAAGRLVLSVQKVAT